MTTSSGSGNVFKTTGFWLFMGALLFAAILYDAIMKPQGAVSIFTTLVNGIQNIGLIFTGRNPSGYTG